MKNLLFAMLFCVSACGAKSPSQPPAHAEHHHHGQEGCDCGDGCAITQLGVQVVYEESSDGAAMVFTAEGERVGEVQSRVAKMADKHNEPRPHRGHHRARHHVPHSARADNVEKGARLVMTPAEPSELEALRKHVRAHVERIQRGEAPTKSCERR